MANYNKQDFVAKAIESVLSQSFSDFELLIVDDASTDSSMKIIQSYASDQRVKLLTHKENLGPSASRNSGIRGSHGSLVCFCDSDDLYSPNMLFEQLNARRDIQYPLVTCTDWTKIDKNGTQRNSVHPPHYSKSGMLFADLLVGNPIVHATCMIPRECFDIVGLYDESLLIGEDIDMSLRLARQFPFKFLPKALYFYRIYGGNTEDRLGKRRRYGDMATASERHFVASRKSLDKATKERAAKRLFSCIMAARKYRELLRLMSTDIYFANLSMSLLFSKFANRKAEDPTS